jgi:hypothetical protein
MSMHTAYLDEAEHYLAVQLSPASKCIARGMLRLVASLDERGLNFPIVTASIDGTVQARCNNGVFEVTA